MLRRAVLPWYSKSLTDGTGMCKMTLSRPIIDLENRVLYGYKDFEVRMIYKTFWNVLAPILICINLRVESSNSKPQRCYAHVLGC